jgi:acyl-CoA dehydrogenase
VGPDLEEFRRSVQEVLDRHLTRAGARDVTWGTGDDSVGLISERSVDAQEAELREAREWRRTLADHGLSWIDGPVEYGGAGLTAEHVRVFHEVLADYDAPSQGPLFGLGIIAPTILEFGSAEAKARYLPAMFRGDVVACQLFSEPEAGSDLAGVRTRAVRDGDVWRISGQKIWSSAAHVADIGQILVRTAQGGSRHAGLSMFLIDMRQPGVTVRPIVESTGKANFNEVYLDDAVALDAHRLGAEGEGWRVAMATMRHERNAISRGGGGAGNSATGAINTERLVQTVDRYAAEDEHAQDLFVAAHVRRSAVEAFARLSRIAEVTDSTDGSAMAVAKLIQARAFEATSDALRAALDRRLWADHGEWGTYAWNDYVLDVESMKIAGGTTEILRTIVAERVLGLPKPPAGSR